ncbi:MAG: hypothetical protein LBT64_02015 [Puniceicoccales bacterium]|jgi:tetratricopeptide (TPR) repeat protein|nr:hypothetical protein [Puniceicoccales bacterium]
MQSEKHPEDNGILARAKLAVEEHDFEYARFLYEEALSINPQDNDARAGMHKLRELGGRSDSILNGVAVGYRSLRILIKYAMAQYDEAIREAEKLLDIAPDSNFALRNILRAAHKAGYNKLVIFMAEKMMQSECAVEDLITMAHAFLNEKIFDQAANVAKEIAEIDPENEEAKDILWKSSVEKHMNADVQLVTAGGEKRFVPPKVDQDKIFIASHNDKSKDADKNAAPKKKVKK